MEAAGTEGPKAHMKRWWRRRPPKPSPSRFRAVSKPSEKYKENLRTRFLLVH
jgi:hypothetical protein